jgi:Ca2+-binding EF-hand superfamily protein
MSASTPSRTFVFHTAIKIIAEADNDMSGTIDFSEFLKIIVKERNQDRSPEIVQDLIDAFVACGGNADKSGCVKKDHLIKIIKIDFGLNIDIEQMIQEVDKDNNGEIDFLEFECLFTDIDLDDDDQSTGTQYYD